MDLIITRIETARKRIDMLDNLNTLLGQAIDDAHQALHDLELVLQGQGELLSESGATDGGDAVSPIDDARASRASACDLTYERVPETRR